jgi:hypothetical protein
MSLGVSVYLMDKVALLGKYTRCEDLLLMTDAINWIHLLIDLSYYSFWLFFRHCSINACGFLVWLIIHWPCL